MSDAPPKPETPKTKPSKLVLALLVLNLGATGFVTFKIITTTPHAAAAATPPAPALPGSEVGPVHSLDPFVVNLDETGQSRYLKVTMQLELTSKDVVSKITKSQQVIRDAILSHLSGLKLADTLGVAAKDKLRGEVMGKLEAILGPGKIRRLFFQEFVVQ